MDIHRVTTQGAYTPSMPQETQALSMRQSVDRLAQHHDTQSHNNACCIVRCFRRICDYLVSIFRCLFGGSQIRSRLVSKGIETTHTRTEPQPLARVAEPARPPPSNPVYIEALQQAQAELEKGISVSAEGIKKIRLLDLDLHNIEDFNHSGSSNVVFSIMKTDPGLVFKRSRAIHDAEQETEEHFANMIKAQVICTKYKLDLLVIPHAKKVQVYRSTTYIAQERLPLSPDELQEQNYMLSGLDKAVEQLAIFIAKTTLAHVKWCKIPVLNIEPEFQFSRKIALINLAKRGDAVGGICGLIGCLFSEKQIDSVLNVAKEHGIPIAETVKASRMQTIEEDRALFAWHKEKGIVDEPKKLIEPDFAALGLNLDEQGTITIEKPTQLREVAKFFIDKINDKIKNAPDWGPGAVNVKMTRYLLLNSEIFADAPLPPETLTKEQDMQRWVYRILNALVQHRYLFKWEKSLSGSSLIIQA